MSITTPDNDRRIQYTATGGQTVFPYDFPIAAEGDLVVIQEGATLTITTDYTVSGVGVQGGGNVTLVSGATLNDVVTIYGDEDIARTSNFNTAGDFIADTLNNQLNSIVRWGQQLERDINRVVKLDQEDTASSLTLPVTADRISKFLAFDSSGDPIASAGTVGDSPVAVSAFIETLLDDADAATARTTLGLGTLATQSGTFSGTSSGTNTGDQSLFSTIAVSGQSNVVADSATDTLTLVAGTNVTITTNATTDEVTINSTASSVMELIASATASSSATIDFTGLSSTYAYYIVEFHNLVPQTDDTFFYMRTSTNGGSSYDAGASDYSWALDRNSTGGGGFVAAVDAADSQISISPQTATLGFGTASNEKASGMVFIYRPSDAEYLKVNYQMSYLASASAALVNIGGAGARLSAGDVDAIRFLMSSGNIASGTFKLYGVKNA